MVKNYSEEYVLHSKINMDTDNNTWNFYQDFIVFKTATHYLSLMHNGDNKVQEKNNWGVH